MLQLSTLRFGAVARAEGDIITFPGGIHGFELHRQWILLSDREHGGLFWLQNAEQADLSLAVVNPREFVDDYTLHVERQQLASIWRGTESLAVLAVLTEYQDQLRLNLRNPIVVSCANRLGRQVVTCDESPLHFTLSGQTLPLREAA
jgi:flagellar assembly factor FliW